MMAKIAIKEIDRIVKGGIRLLKKSLTNQDWGYWPQSGANNGLPERNISTYVAHQFLKRGWFVYTEASIKGLRKKRLDLLALKRGVLVACESKQLHDATKAKELEDDAGRIKRFRLLKKYDPPPVKQRYGLLLATAWEHDKVEWWQRKGAQPSLSSRYKGQQWKLLGKYL